MSLIFAAAIEEFSPEEATHLCPSSGAVRPTRDETVPIRGLLEFATRHSWLDHDQEGYVYLPLHESTSAGLSGKYLLYADHPMHGEVIIYRDGPGDERGSIDVDEFGATPLARRVRFWHSDYVPDTMPDYYESPLSDSEPPRNPIGDPDRFFDRLQGYVDREREATRDDNREQVAEASPRELYEEGHDAIPALLNPGNKRQKRLTLQVSTGLVEEILDVDLSGDTGGKADSGQPQVDLPHRFVQGEFGIHEGNEALLIPPSREHSPDDFPIPVTVDRIQGRTATVSPTWDPVDNVTEVGDYLTKKRRGFGLVLLLNDVPHEREEAAIESLRQDRTFRQLLTGQRSITFTDTSAVDSTQQDDALNQEQQLAVEHALLADPLFCIHGPPGTGKTRTLVEIVRRAARSGQSILVAADSNQAIDNLLVGDSTPGNPDEASLHANGQHGAGEFTINRNNARRSRHPVVDRDYTGSVEGLADVVVATNSSTARLERRFDLAVIDEATQSTCTASAIPMAAAEKVVLAGDHKQLPPFSASEEPPESTLGLSLFEHLYADGGVYEGVGIQLRTQYRMHPDVARFPNRRFYDRSLRHGRDIDPLDGEDIQVLNDQTGIMGYEIGGVETIQGHSVANEQEAELVAYIVGQLLETTLAPSDIGVITPYVAQVRTIERLLSDEVESGAGVTVDTIDSFQGSEREAIVLSLTRSNPDGEIGFLGRLPDGPRRLNVALTRARRFCGIVGDWSTLTAAADRKECQDLYERLHSELADTDRLKRVDPLMIDLSSV